MKNKIGILIDSTTNIANEFDAYPFVKTVQLKVDVEHKVYKESELSKTQMMTYIEEQKKMKTSQPSPAEFLEMYQAFCDEGYTHVLVVLITEKLSGTFQSAMIAKTMFESDLEISIHSPECASFGIANGLRVLIKDIETISFDDLLKKYYALFEKTHVSFTLENLKHLFVGGRLSRITAFIGTVLRIKPIVEMVEGKLKMVKKERTNNGCLKFFLSKVDEMASEKKKLYIDVIHLNMPEWASKLSKAIQETYPEATIHITDQVSPVFFVHLGDKGFGVAITGMNE